MSNLITFYRLNVDSLQPTCIDPSPLYNKIKTKSFLDSKQNNISSGMNFVLNSFKYINMNV